MVVKMQKVKEKILAEKLVEWTEQSDETGASLTLLKLFAENQGISEGFVDEFIEKCLRNGTVYHPTDDENDIAVNADVVDLETE